MNRQVLRWINPAVNEQDDSELPLGVNQGSTDKNIAVTVGQALQVA